MQTLIIETEGKKLNAIIAVLEALEIPFSKPIPSEKYATLNRKISEGREEKNEGTLQSIDVERE